MRYARLQRSIHRWNSSNGVEAAEDANAAAARETAGAVGATGRLLLLLLLLMPGLAKLALPGCWPMKGPHWRRPPQRQSPAVKLAGCAGSRIRPGPTPAKPQSRSDAGGAA